MIDVDDYSLKKKLKILENFWDYAEVNVRAALIEKDENVVDAWLDILLNGAAEEYEGWDFFGTEGLAPILFE